MNHEQRIKEIVAKNLDLTSTDFSSNTTFIDLGADSLTVIEIMLDIERAYSKEIPNNITPPKNVKEVVAYIEEFWQ